MRSFRKILPALFVVSLVGCDSATKHVASSALSGKPSLSLVDGLLRAEYTENRGAAFSLFHSLPREYGHWLLAAMAAVALSGVLAMWWVRRARPVIEHAAFALIAAGAIGNLIDRVLRGYVIDFLRLPYWPVFNMADIWIVIGVALLAIAGWREARNRVTTS